MGCQHRRLRKGTVQILCIKICLPLRTVCEKKLYQTVYGSRGSCVKSYIASSDVTRVDVSWDHKLENCIQNVGAELDRSEAARVPHPAPHRCFRLRWLEATTCIKHLNPRRNCLQLSCISGNEGAMVFERKKKTWNKKDSSLVLKVQQCYRG